MFIYERDGKLNIMVVGGKPAPIGESADIVIEPVIDEEEKVTAKVTINGVEVGTELPIASTEELGVIKVGEGLQVSEDGTLALR